MIMHVLISLAEFIGLCVALGAGLALLMLATAALGWLALKMCGYRP
jgi:UPF0716 family protein affecting phage T7 exclusion